MTRIKNSLLWLLAAGMLLPLLIVPQRGEALSEYFIPGDPAVVRYGNLDCGTGHLSPAPATLADGYLRLTPAGNSTYGTLGLEIKTAGGTTYSNTIHGDITQAADKDWTWLKAYPPSTYNVTVDSSGKFGTAAPSSGTVGGSGTDNHIARFDGTGNIQDSGWVIGDDDQQYLVGGGETFVFGTAGGAVGNGHNLEIWTNGGQEFAAFYQTGDAGQRLSFGTSGSDIWFGGGGGAPDIHLSRGAANRLDLASGDSFNLNSASGQILVNAANPRRSIMLRAFEMWPSTTSGCTGPTKNEEATNKQNLYSLGFQGVAGKVYAEFTTPMPDNWDGGSLYAKFYWYANNTNTNGVRWGLECRSYGDAETVDQAWGTAQEVTDTESGTAKQVLISAETPAITPSGTPAGGELLQCRIYRDASHAGDTEFGSVDLISVKLEYSVSQFGE